MFVLHRTPGYTSLHKPMRKGKQMGNQNDTAQYAAQQLWKLLGANEEYMVNLIAAFMRREEKLRKLEDIAREK